MFGSPCYLSGIIETLAPCTPWLWLVLVLVLFMVFFRTVMQLMVELGGKTNPVSPPQPPAPQPSFSTTPAKPFGSPP
jgi:hypothetical protein